MNQWKSTGQRTTTGRNRNQPPRERQRISSERTRNHQERGLHVDEAEINQREIEKIS